MKMTPFAVAALTAAGCASTSPRPSFEQVSKLVEERGGKPLHWDEGTPADAQVQAHVRDLLRGTLTPEGAVEVALLRNQGLVATYEELGVAQADLVQAGLLRNPTFGARVRFPTGAGFTDTEFSIAEDFLGIFTLPLRKRVAVAQLDASKARVGSAVLDLTAEVRGAFVGLQAAQATAKVRQLVLDAQQAAAELRRRQHAAGNVGDLELAQEEAFYQQSKLDFARGRTQVLEQRERLNRLLGLQRDKLRLEGELGQVRADQERMGHQQDEARLQIDQLQQKFRADAAHDLADTRTRLSDIREKLAVAGDVLTRIDIRAPLAGVVQNVRIAGVGAVVKGGDTIAELVPTGDNLMITAQVSPLDVDSVTAGQKAKIRFTSLSSRRVPTVFGRVETVSSDAIYDESSKQSYYLARVAVDPASLPSSIATKLLPGMPAEILIVTGKRTVTDLGPSPKPSSSACAKREHGAMHPGKA